MTALTTARRLTSGTLVAAALATAGIGMHLAQAGLGSTVSLAATADTSARGSSGSAPGSSSTPSTATTSTGAAVAGSAGQAQTSTQGS